MSETPKSSSEVPETADGDRSQPKADPVSYEAPKLTRLGTLLELTRSGVGARVEAFRGSR